MSLRVKWQSAHKAALTYRAKVKENLALKMVGITCELGVTVGMRNMKSSIPSCRKDKASAIGGKEQLHQIGFWFVNSKMPVRTRFRKAS